MHITAVNCQFSTKYFWLNLVQPSFTTFYTNGIIIRDQSPLYS